MANGKYLLTYDIQMHPGGITKAERRGGEGMADAILIASVIHSSDGGQSTAFVSGDGRTGQEMTDTEKFKIWGILANELSESKELGDGHKLLCKTAFEAIRSAVLAARRRT